jgi:predicted phosphodiesterase
MQRLFRRPITQLALRMSSSPRPDKVFASLNDLFSAIQAGKEDRGLLLKTEIDTAKYIIFSDQHKGAGDLADDFHQAKGNYQNALAYYFDQGFTFINLGDCEELWECTPEIAVEHNRDTLLSEAKFLSQSRYYRIFGNHDLEWSYAIQQNQYLKPVFGDSLSILEGVILVIPFMNQNYSILLTHGHQGDIKSDGNAFSKWVVAAIWTPIQRYLEINLNSLSDSFGLVDRHNIIMSNWSETQPNLVLISGHTHKPVFASMDHVDRLKKQKESAEKRNDAAQAKSLQEELNRRMTEYSGKYSRKVLPHPSYFNTGCCCFEDGDITGIELEGGYIRLVKWENKAGNNSVRKVLEESPLTYLFENLMHTPESVKGQQL